MNVRLALVALLLLLLFPPAASAAGAFPPALAARIEAEPPRPGWRIDRSARPVFLTGDFDGRGQREFAVQVEDKAGSLDVLFYLADGKTRRLTRDLGQNWPGPEWKLFPRGRRVPGRSDLNGSHPGTLAVDGIELERPQSSSALVYWLNGRFRIHWLSD